ncbi:orotate phosphoribosyltransferase [Cardiobacteriaceae bacterium TAE3-ERU3]|nr:orotate phosphoribosyltransferase [Cardiobacteriaceae bacterium TAE3-ERU3]
MLAVYQKAFMQTALRVNALKFGEFTLKSGRVSPYFFNAGAFCDGDALLTLARAYAARIIALRDEGMTIEALYGPAYKGIPLVAAIATVLAAEHGWNVPWAFNRKEAKDHGEGGIMVGTDLTGLQVLIIDDVLTAGTAIREALAILGEIEAKPTGVVVALDRQERIGEGASALQTLADGQGLHCEAVVSLDDLLTYVREDEQLERYFPALQAYREQFGV